MSYLRDVQQISWFEFSLPQIPVEQPEPVKKKIKNSTCVTRAIVIFALCVTWLIVK